MKHLINRSYTRKTITNNANVIKTDGIETKINEIEIRISVVKEGEREYLYINGMKTVKIIPIASNCFYVDTGKE